MKSTPVTLACFLAALFAAGCQIAGFTESERPNGKPVVTLASIAEAKTGTTKDLSPALPFTLPNYPTALLQEGVEGFVDVRIAILPDGSVGTATVLKSTEEDFSKPVVAAVKTWQFPQLCREKSDADRDVELMCRISFSIQEYWRDSIGGDP